MKNQNQSRTVEESRYVILDTNILSRLSKETFGEKITLLLKETQSINPGWGIAISDITTFEVLDRLPYKKEAGAFTILNQFEYYAVDRNILTLAGKLGVSLQRL